MADSNSPIPSVLDQAKAANVLKPTQAATASVTKPPDPKPPEWWSESGSKPLPAGLKELPKVTVTQEFNSSGGHKLMVEVEGQTPVYSEWAAYNTLASVTHPATGKLYIGASDYFQGKLPPVFIVQEITDFHRRKIS